MGDFNQQRSWVPQTIDEMERMPGFARLPLQDQQILRATFVQQKIDSSPLGASLSERDRQMVLSSALNRAPVLETLDVSAHDLVGLAENVRRGEMTDEAFERFLKIRIEEEAGLVGSALKAIGRVAGLEYYEDSPNEETARDRAKAYEYFMGTLNTAESTQKGAGVANVLIPLAGVVLDVVTARGAQGLALRLAGKVNPSVANRVSTWLLGADNFSRLNAPATTSRLAHWFQTRGLPGLVQSGIDSTFITTSNVIRDNLRSDWLNEPRKQLTVLNLATQFGEEMVWDYLFFAGLQAVAPILRGTKAAFGKFSDVVKGQTILDKRLGELDIDDMARRVMTGDYSDEVLATMSRAERESAKFRRNVTTIEGRLGKLSPEARDSVIAGSKGFDIRPVGGNSEAALDYADQLRRRADQWYEDTLTSLGEASGISQESAESIGREYMQRMAEAKRAAENMKVSGWALRDMRGEAPRDLGVFSSSEDAVAGMFKIVNSEMDAPVRGFPSGMSVTDDSLIRIQEKVVGPIAARGDVDTVTRLRSVFRDVLAKEGELPEAAVMNAARQLLKEADGTLGDAAKLGVRRVSNSTWENLTYKEIVQDGYLQIPVRLGFSETGVLDEIQFGSKFIRGMEYWLEKERGSALSESARSVFRTAYDEVLDHVSKRGVTYSWLKFQAQRFWPGSVVVRDAKIPGVKVTMPTGEVLHYANATKMAEDLFRRSASEAKATGTWWDLVRTNSRVRFGIEIDVKKTAEGVERVFARKDGKVVGVARTLDQLLEDKPFLQPKLPVSMAPDFMVVDLTKGRKEVVMDGEIFLGGMDDVLRELSNYDEPLASAEKALVRSGVDYNIAYHRVYRNYEVEIPGLGWKGTFASKKSLEVFLQEGWKNSRALSMMASQKGAHVSLGSQGWLVRTLDGEVFTAADVDELAQVVKTLAPNPTAGKDLLDLSPELRQWVDEELADMLTPIDAGNKAYSQNAVDDWLARQRFRYERGKERTAWMGWSMATRNKHEVIRDLATIYNKPVLGSTMTKFENAKQFALASTKRAEAMLNGIWKRVPEKARRELLPLLQYNADEWDSVLAKIQKGKPDSQKIVLNAAHRDALEKHRDFLQRYLSAEFGVDVYKWQRDYLPRIRDRMVKSQKELLAGLAESKDVTKFFWKEFEKVVPTHEVQFFSEYLRVSEWAEYLGATDPVDLTMSYIRQGYRRKMLKGPYEDFVQILNDMTDVPEKYRRYVAEYLTDSMGWSDDVLGDALDDVISGIQQSLAKKGAISGPVDVAQKRGHKFIHSLQAWTVGATMAFRPHLVMRNIHQIYQTGAMFLGFDAIQEGMERFLKLSADPDAFFRKLVEPGVIKAQVTPIMQLEGGRSFIDEFNRIGMGPFFNSDVVNRATIYLATEALWDRAMPKIASAGGPEKVPFKVLADWLELDGLHPEDVRELTKLWRESGEEAAKSFHGRRLVDLSQFPYDSAVNPRMFKGVLGRIFGQFGHYPLSYVEALRQMIGRRRGKSLVKAVGRLAVASAAMGLTWEKVMGVNPTQYYPWGQMFFTAGPYIDLSMMALQSMDPSSWDGQQARERLASQAASVFVPGMAIARNWQVALELAGTGDYYGTFLKLMTAPYIGFE